MSALNCCFYLFNCNLKDIRGKINIFLPSYTLCSVFLILTAKTQFIPTDYLPSLLVTCCFKHLTLTNSMTFPHYFVASKVASISSSTSPAFVPLFDILNPLSPTLEVSPLVVSTYFHIGSTSSGVASSKIFDTVNHLLIIQNFFFLLR